jgi:Ser/Thr protein kinase RdoA (MazF antagonist)
MTRLDRVGTENLPRHLEGVYDIAIDAVQELDLGVYRVDRADGPSWIARVMPAERPFEWSRGDAAILHFLAESGYPAERCATAAPVSVLEEQAVLVTELVPGVPRAERRDAIREAGGLAKLGRLLGRLHELESERSAARSGGAWHHLADGAPSDEIAALRRILDAAERPSGRRRAAQFGTLIRAAESLDDGTGLPEALVHPDFVLANVVASRDDGMVLVDWTGAGRGPRAWSLAFLLWSVGYEGDMRRVDRTAAGYGRCVTLEPEELDRLEALVCARPILFDVWAFCTSRKTLGESSAGLAASREAATAIAGRARSVFAAPG